MSSGGGGARTSRGGRDQFAWSDVAADRHRENYLGHSILAPVGRWQQGKDLMWYAKEKAPPGMAGAKLEGGSAAAAQAAALAAERAAIKQEEEERRLEALGIRKRVPKPPPAAPALDPQEAAQLFSRSKAEAGADGAAGAPAGHDADRVSGLGFKSDPSAPTSAGGVKLELEAGGAMEGTVDAHAAAAGSDGAIAAPAMPSAAATAAAGAAAASSTLDFSSEAALLSDPSLDAASRAILLEAAAIRAKEARKREKQEARKAGKEEGGRKKEHKKERKKEKKRSRSRSRSRDRERERARDREKDRQAQKQGT